LADNARDAYVAGLTLLARRELSEAQVRQRLARRGFSPAEVDAAVQRLKTERALDDARVAEAIARTEVHVRRRGRLQADRRIRSAGISATIARAALDQTYAEIDADALLTAALARRLQGDDQIADRREFGRLYRYLIGQGFEPDRVLAALRARSRKAPGDD
jgi:regulatory protein